MSITPNKINFNILTIFAFYLIISGSFDCYIDLTEYNNNIGLLKVYIGIVILVLRISTSYFKRKLLDAFPLTLIIFSIYYVCGICVYYFRDTYLFNLTGNISRVNNASFIGIISMIISYMYLSIIYETFHYKRNIDLNKLAYLNTERIKITLYILSIFGFLSAMLFYDFFRSIPIFADKIDLARKEIVETRGRFFSGLVYLIHAIALNCYMFTNKNIKYTFKRKTIFILFTLIMALPLIFYGGRFLVFFPVLLCTLIYVQEVSGISVIKLAISSFALLTLSMIYVSFRIFGNNLNFLLFLTALSADIFPEMRSFATASVRLEANAFFHEVFITPFIGLFPSKLLAILTISKQELWKTIGSRVLDIFPEAGDSIPAIRISLIGELYLGGGYWGVIISMAILGAVIFFVEKMYADKSGFERYPLLVFSSTVPLLMPYGTIFLINIFYYFLQAYLISIFVTKKSYLTPLGRSFNSIKS